MKPIQRLLIFERKEFYTLFLLGVFSLVFTFTLGVHLGKRVGNRTWSDKKDPKSPIATLDDQIASHDEFTEQGKGVQKAIDDILQIDLKNEISRTDLKLGTPRQVDLPEHPKDKKAGATTLSHDIAARRIASTEHTGHSIEHPKYTLQVGSFPEMKEAKHTLSALKDAHTKSMLKETDVKGIGKRYRIYLGEYQTKDSAEKAGKNLQAQNKISNFIVVNYPN